MRLVAEKSSQALTHRGEDGNSLNRDIVEEEDQSQHQCVDGEDARKDSFRVHLVEDRRREVLARDAPFRES